MPSIRRAALDAAAVALALDELLDIAGHLPEEQAHRDVGQAYSDGERDEKSGDENDECENRRHTSNYSNRPAVESFPELMAR
jgi:hypothetical protein